MNAGAFIFTSGIDLPAKDVFWRPEANPFVLATEARPVAADHPDAFDVRRFGSFATVLCGGGQEHVLFGDGLRHLQLTVTAGSVLDGPVCLHYPLSGVRRMEAKVLTLQRLSGLCRLGRLPLSLYPPERRAGRWAMMLRAFDGAAAGASQRDIAAVLYGERAVREDWQAGFLRTRVQRLLSGARTMVRGGYRKLLDPQERGVRGG
ncbi:DUF2285 domain-containing protein [Nitratireductor sp. XY-223]|uniref:DUF2285 domain-containing protein n=1 Tax=Nitratireductor sp. XY-223 TaxID=2561926 RepID=UPI0010AAECC8|nr:DUF2285 domain-containing protein [Nitratireductor sp. XY-223]